MAKDSAPQDEELQPERQRTMALLGHCIVAWSFVERSIEHSLIILLVGSGLPEEEATIVATTMDVRDRVSLCAALGYKMAPKEPWFREMIALHNHATNELRNQRNRLLHDAWSIDGPRLARRSSSKPRLARPQSRELELVLPSFKPVTDDEIREFFDACTKATDDISEMNKRILSYYTQIGLPKRSA